MSRAHFSSGRIAVTIGLLAIGLVCMPISSGQNANVKKLSIHEKLAMEIETTPFTDPMTLKDFIELLYKQTAAKGVELAILVDFASFKQEEGAPTPYDSQVQLPAVPKTMTVGEALRMAISQIASNNGAMILRDGKVEITTMNAASLPTLLQAKFRPRHFDQVPFADAMRQMSDMSGVSIVLDPRAKEKGPTPVSTDFRGDVPVEAALRMLSNMVDLRNVLMEGGVYVTTPSNAETLEKQVRDRNLEREKEKKKARLSQPDAGV
jgi:hypothetical protein